MDIYFCPVQFFLINKIAELFTTQAKYIWHYYRLHDNGSFVCQEVNKTLISLKKTKLFQLNMAMVTCIKEGKCEYENKSLSYYFYTDQICD